MDIHFVITALEIKIDAEGTQKAAAKKLGVSEQYLSDVLKRRREPGKKLLAAMRLRRVVTYEPSAPRKQEA